MISKAFPKKKSTPSSSFLHEPVPGQYDCRLKRVLSLALRKEAITNDSSKPFSDNVGNCLVTKAKSRNATQRVVSVARLVMRQAQSELFLILILVILKEGEVLDYLYTFYLTS